MADPDIVAVKGLDHRRSKVDQFEPLCNVGRRFANLRRDQLDGVFWFFQIKKRFEALRLLHRVNLGALKVLDKLGLQHFRVGHFPNADRHGRSRGQFRTPVATFSEDDLEVPFATRPHQ